MDADQAGCRASSRPNWHHLSESPADQGGRGPTMLTGMVDLTPDEHGTARDRLLVPGRFGKVYADWLTARSGLPRWCPGRDLVPVPRV